MPQYVHWQFWYAKKYAIVDHSRFGILRLQIVINTLSSSRKLILLLTSCDLQKFHSSQIDCKKKKTGGKEGPHEIYQFISIANITIIGIGMVLV